MSSKTTNINPKLVRVVWNTNGWRFPSGPNGKSNNAGNHEHDYGYGYEEWLFDPNKVIDGYQYGFLQPFNQYFHLYAGQIFSDIHLFAINSNNSLRYEVAHLRDVEVLTENECQSIMAEYHQRGWREEMRKQIAGLKLGQNDLSPHHNGRLANVRFKRTDELTSKAIKLIPLTHPVYRLNRFKLYDADGMELPF